MPMFHIEQFKRNSPNAQNRKSCTFGLNPEYTEYTVRRLSYHRSQYPKIENPEYAVGSAIYLITRNISKSEISPVSCTGRYRVSPQTLKFARKRAPKEAERETVCIKRKPLNR